MEQVDPTNSEQNAWVQDWLTAWMNKHGAGSDVTAFDTTIECIQETYSPYPNVKDSSDD